MLRDLKVYFKSASLLTAFQAAFLATSTMSNKLGSFVQLGSEFKKRTCLLLVAEHFALPDRLRIVFENK